MKIDLLKFYNHFVLLVWGALGMNFVFQYSQHGPWLEAILAAGCILVVAYPLTTYLSTTLLYKAMLRKKMKLFILQFVLFSAVTTVFLLIFGCVFSILEKEGVFPDSELFSALDSPVNEILNTILVSWFINFGFCGLRFFEENLKLQQELTESQMEILKTQINPHFMFNVLNHIHVLMQKDVDLASSLLLQYSDILRYQLYNSKEEQVSIGQEVDFLKNYIEVEKLRWKGKLRVTSYWDIEDDTWSLAPLLMITFIENAFKYVSRSDSEKGYVYIKLKQSLNQLSLEVENSKSQVIVANKKHLGIGLENIRKRLDILYPGKYQLGIDDSNFVYNLRFTLET